MFNLVHSRVETHHKDDIPNFEESSKEAGRLQRLYMDWVTTVLPERKSLIRLIYLIFNMSCLSGLDKKTDFSYEIGRGEDGLPEFPEYEVERERPDVSRALVTGYFTYLWRK